MKPRRIWIVLLALLPLLMFSAYASARAGGGEGFHSSPSGGGGGGLIFDLIWLCLSHPILGIPLIIIIAVVWYYYSKNMPASPPEAEEQSTIRRQAHGDPVAVVRSHDPGFDPNAFCNRVGAGFLKLQSAWCNQNLQEVRPFISDGIHERFSLQFAEQKGEGYHDRMDGVGIDQITIADAGSDEIYDELSVRIAAHAADYKVAMRDGKPIEGVAPMQGFVEIWSFLRRRGSATVPGKLGLLEGNCPNCGAPIELNESANCRNCNALLRSGQYDWVLSEITQASEWTPGRHEDVRGLAALRVRDPDLNVQNLEDRTSVIFWRKSAADRLGRLDPMFKVTTPEYGQGYARRLKPAGGEPRTYFGRCAVGSVAVLGFVSTASDALVGDSAEASAVDRALVEIRWTGTKMAVQPDRTAKPIEQYSLHHTLFVLMRKSASKTDVAKGISSAHCPNCGAPESGGTTGACEFCGTALNDGSNGWVLENILGFADNDAQTLLASMNRG